MSLFIPSQRITTGPTVHPALYQSRTPRNTIPVATKFLRESLFLLNHPGVPISLHLTSYRVSPQDGPASQLTTPLPRSTETWTGGTVRDDARSVRTRRPRSQVQSKRTDPLSPPELLLFTSFS
jgi:hypothetical protein